MKKKLHPIDKIEPKFTHDCTNCIFLTHLLDCDLYYCQHINSRDLIARFGNDWSEYSSAADWCFNNEFIQHLIKGDKQQRALAICYILTRDI